MSRADQSFGQEPFDLEIPIVEASPDVEHAKQWRLEGVEIANWGTMDGRIYRFPISRRGHLITGPSGSGKSSILDAIAAVITPDRWLKFNQAAQTGGERSAHRSVISYLRGAWSRQQDEREDRVVSAFLRPKATWSGVVLHYGDGAGGTVTLARLFFLRGTTMSRSEMKDVCLLERSQVSLADLQSLIDDGIRTRRIQERWPKAVVTTNGTHGQFYARMRSVFGMRDEAALRLLHRTQSAKGLDSLDQLFRHHMLEVPSTFAMADRAVEEFGALRTAYERVTDLRRQRDHLLGVRDASRAYDDAEAAASHLRRLQSAIHPYQQKRQLDEIRRELTEIAGSLEGLRQDRRTADAVLDSAEERYGSAFLALNRAGGGEVADLNRQIASAEDQLQERRDRHQLLLARLRDAGIDSTPRTAAEYAELQTAIDSDLAQAQVVEGPSHEQHAELSRRRAAVKDIDADIAALRAGRSAVPRGLLEVRQMLVEEIGASGEDLRFAAELIDVDPEHASWTGAIERVLAPLSLTLLVPSRLLEAAQAWIDNHHLGLRLRFEAVTSGRVTVTPASSQDSLVHKVQVKPGQFHDWLQARLSDRFDFACVSTSAELKRHARAVTLAGQVKLSATRFEKNDRFRVDDRSRWVLGDPAAKLEVLVESRRVAADALQAIEADVRSAQERAGEVQRRRASLSAVRDTPWKDVDVRTIEERISALNARLVEFSSADASLEEARIRCDDAQRALSVARTESENAGLALDRAEQERAKLVHEEADLEAMCAEHAPLADELVDELDTRFREVRRAATRTRLPDIADTVRSDVAAQLERAQADAEKAAQRCTVLTTEFSQQWPAAAADATPGVEDREAYLTVLDRIVGQGLPEHEERFQRMLHDRSSVLFGELHSAIRSAPGEVEDRVEPINASLRRSPFDEGRFLRLRVRTRRNETVTQFLSDLASASTHSWTDDTLDDAERRYTALASVMDRLASSDYVDRAWRQQCLDTREQVTFLAQEIDEAGVVHATYDSGAAMSGGQQQKLVIFCLAAALRFQLAAPEDLLPSYGTVILDEAFDKADARYTRMAMDVFVEFGFQMVLATPQKLLQTIEPYVGGITTVENPSRRLTLLADVTWEDEES